jgi:dihydrofolate reductase
MNGARFVHDRLGLAEWQVEIADAQWRLHLLAAGDQQVVVHASPRLAATLRKAGLVDHLRLLLQPLVAGAGPALFDEDETLRLELQSARAHRSGAVALDYAVGR